jgi:hypothetical protein
MLFPSLGACLLALPLLASGNTLRNVFVPRNESAPKAINSSPSDVSSLVDDFVEVWKKDNPDLATSQLEKIHDSANAVKVALLNPTTNINNTKREYHHSSSPHSVHHTSFHRRQIANSTLPSGNSTTVEEAREIVRRAQKEANARNRERFENPRLNNYYASFSKPAALKARADDAAAITPNATVKAAAAVVAEADAEHLQPDTYPGLPAELQQLKDELHGPPSADSSGLNKRATGGSFWMENIAHQGRVPYGGDSGYVVFRNVKNYGAVGDGKTDDTAAINKAMTDGKRCGKNCGASTTKPAIVYFPAGTYLVSSTIPAYYNTQIIGNANNLPIIKAAASFVGLGVISSDEYTGGDGGEEEWFINQNNFLRQLRNFIIDVRSADMTDIAGVHWQVAQATSIQNVIFYQSDAAGKTHKGIFAENGSGGFMSDLTFFGGDTGIRCG